MPNIQASIDGIRGKASELGSIKNGFEDCNQQMRTLVQNLEAEGAQKFNGAAGLEYKTQFSIYANNLSKISNVFDVLQRTTDQSADILEAAQARIQQRLFSSKIATSSFNAFSGNFVNQDSIYQPSFTDVSFEKQENGTYKILAKDGTALGFTTEEGKLAYEGQGMLSNGGNSSGVISTENVDIGTATAANPMNGTLHSKVPGSFTVGIGQQASTDVVPDMMASSDVEIEVLDDAMTSSSNVSVSGERMAVPQGVNTSTMTFEHANKITNPTAECYNIVHGEGEYAGRVHVDDVNGIQYMQGDDGNKYYQVAMGNAYGKTGDTFKIQTENGAEFFVVKTDEKSINDSNMVRDANGQGWYHQTGGTANLIEFVVDHKSPDVIGGYQVLPEFGGDGSKGSNIVNIEKIGSI